MTTNDPAQPMIDWVINAPPADLAVELMTIYGPDGPRPTFGPDVTMFRDWMFRDYPRQTGIVFRVRTPEEPILEAIQLLEHAELIYLRAISEVGRRWMATRLGQATLASGKPIVRQRIKDRTGL